LNLIILRFYQEKSSAHACAMDKNRLLLCFVPSLVPTSKGSLPLKLKEKLFSMEGEAQPVCLNHWSKTYPPQHQIKPTPAIRIFKSVSLSQMVTHSCSPGAIACHVQRESVSSLLQTETGKSFFVSSLSWFDVATGKRGLCSLTTECCCCPSVEMLTVTC